jgi:hypothetical protein
MSAPSQLFEQFKQEGFALIDRAVKEKWQESLYLEFKIAATSDGALTKDDRKNYAEAASGFANSDGGVIVWGVDARRDRKTGIDAASGLKPIKNISRFLSDLNTQLVNLVSPGVESIDHHPIEHLGRQGDGYVVTLVPKGEGLPHMVVQGEDRGRHYHRVGSSFVIMEPYVLADRFGRRPQPKLQLARKFPPPWTSSEYGRKVYHFELVLGIRNAGRGVALYPAICIYETQDLKVSGRGLDADGNTGLPERPRTAQRPEEAVRFFAGGVDHVVHPGTELWVTCSRFKVPETEESWRDTKVQYELFCDGFFSSGAEVVPGGEVIRAMQEAKGQ